MATPRDERSQEQKDFDKYQQEEAIRIANEEGPGEATNPEITANATRAQGSPTSDENFDDQQAPREGMNMENRDLNKTGGINNAASDS